VCIVKSFVGRSIRVRRRSSDVPWAEVCETGLERRLKAAFIGRSDPALGNVLDNACRSAQRAAGWDWPS
jgi:hypothetical protein